MAKIAVPSLTEKKKTTRYRDGKVVTTTGAKVRHDMRKGVLFADKPIAAAVPIDAGRCFCVLL